MADAWDERKKGQEEEYFHRKEQEALAKTRERAAAEERQRGQESSLRCPKCGDQLAEITFQEIQVDRCNGCHGIWLDPGELERVTQRDDQGWLTKLWRNQSS